MPSRMGVMKDVQHTPTEADPPISDFYSFDTLTSDSGASPIDPLSTALDVVLTAEVWLSQLGSHKTPSPMYLPRTRSGRI